MRELDRDSRAPCTHRIDCLGVPVAVANPATLYDWLFASARQREGVKSVYFANAHTLNLAWNNVAFRDVLCRADLVLNDGIGLEIYARIAGQRFEKNFNGTDLLPDVFARAPEDHPVTVYLFGGVKGRAERAAQLIEQRFRGIRVVGTRDGYTQQGALESINRQSPDILLVAMGNPLQEMWIDSMRPQLNAGIAFGVGALIDFLSESIARAPEWVRAARLEWTFRLSREPRRLFTRYVVGNPAFIIRSIAYTKLGVRKGKMR